MPLWQKLALLAGGVLLLGGRGGHAWPGAD